MHQGEVTRDGPLQHVLHAVEDPDLLRLRRQGDRAVGAVAQRQAPVGHLGADPGAGVEGGDPRAAGAQALGQRALGHQLDLEFTREVLTRELSVLPT